ncbi:MAG: hypothetical protein K0S65_1123 [Labilithrix sp.]|nr:hypothetical protein [Labilithrix sp.]
MTKAKRRLGRAAFFLVIVLGAAALMLFSRRVARRPGSGLSRTPTGGAALIDDARAASHDADDGPDLVEDARRYSVRVWSFPIERWALRIEDAGMTTALDKVLERTGAELVVNGGFFDSEGNPVGLAVSNGAVLSRLSKSLSGGVLAADDARAELFAAESFVASDGGAFPFAVQCRPRLVVDGTANVKRDDEKRAERTALCLRDAGRTVDVVIVRGSDDGESPGPSLFALARHLADAGCESALNLDGGPSTGVAWREGSEVKLLAPRGPIRHVIAFRERR